MEESAETTLEAMSTVSWFDLANEVPLKAFGGLRALSEQLSESNPVAAVGFEVLSTVSGMMLDGTRWDQPYSPFARFGNRRTRVPSDLTQRELDFLSSARELIPGTELALRIADVLFVREGDRGKRFALAREVVTERIALGLDTESSSSGEEGWVRAAEIAGRFQMAHEIDQLVEVALTAFRASSAVGALHVARAMRSVRFYGDERDEVANRLEKLAEEQSDGHIARQLLSESIAWRRGEDAESAAARSQQRIGDSWWADAKSRTDSHMVARDFFGNAFHAYRAVPRHLRSKTTQERVVELPRIIREEGDLTLGEMQMFEMGPIDLSPLRDQAEKIADIPDLNTALAVWFQVVPLSSFEEERRTAEKQSEDHALLDLFDKSTLDADGRKIHATGNRAERSGVPESIWARMIENYTHTAITISRGYVWTGVRRFANNHKLNLRDFEVVVSASPFIPPAQETLYARALFHGYYERLPECLFILGPVVEACVRACLQATGVETRNIRSDDTEIEPGLSALMELDGVDDALGADLAWNIRALFCGPTGPNLRNRIAHGLVSAPEANGDIALYAWWFAFRLAFAPYFRAIQEPEAASDETS